jgi:ribosomal protein S18 acetylase RimI-like enzyme
MENIMSQSHDPIRLASQQDKEATKVLSRAFQHDPLWLYLAPDEARRTRMLFSAFRILVRYSLLYGEVYTTAGLDGQACWLPPGQTTPRIGRLLRIGVRGVPFQFGWKGLRRYADVERFTAAAHKRIAPEQHWYLWGLGVEPLCQGRGIGSMLIRPVLQRADAGSLPCYLETMNEQNVPFYQKHGFNVMDEEEVSSGDGSRVHIWAMLREPGS